MIWALLALFVALCWATVNLIDKIILSNYIKHPIIPVITLGIMSIIIAPIIYLIEGFSFLSDVNILIALLSGIFYVLFSIFYFKAVKVGEISRIVPLFYISPLIILILAAVFLNEQLRVASYFGVILIVVGAMLISSENILKIKPEKYFWLMMLSATSFAIAGIMIEYLLNFADYWTIFAYSRTGTFLATIPLIYMYYPELSKTIKNKGLKPISYLFANESFNLFGLLMITIAMSFGYITLVSALSSVQPFFLLVYVVILSMFFPHILKEETSKKIIVSKLIAISIMFMGVYFIL